MIQTTNQLLYHDLFIVEIETGGLSPSQKYRHLGSHPNSGRIGWTFLTHNDSKTVESTNQFSWFTMVYIPIFSWLNRHGSQISQLLKHAKTHQHRGLFLECEDSPGTPVMIVSRAVHDCWRSPQWVGSNYCLVIHELWGVP